MNSSGWAPATDAGGNHPWSETPSSAMARPDLGMPAEKYGRFSISRTRRPEITDASAVSLRRPNGSASPAHHRTPPRRNDCAHPPSMILSRQASFPFARDGKEPVSGKRTSTSKSTKRDRNGHRLVGTLSFSLIGPRDRFIKSASHMQNPPPATSARQASGSPKVGRIARRQRKTCVFMENSIGPRG